ncbi:hypothetical protein [Pseudoxanthomonas wuyuanensis]
MKPTPATRRLLLAASVAIASQWLLSWLLPRIPGVAGSDLQTAAGWLSPASYVAVALAMGVGGWIAGYRFVPFAVSINLLIWLVILTVLAEMSAPLTEKPFLRNLGASLQFNALGMTCSLLAAAAGAAIGAWLHRGRNLPPTVPTP